MARVGKKRSEKSGLPPGTLVHIGPKRERKVKISVIDYSADNFEEKVVGGVEECFPFRDKPTITWVNVDGIHDVTAIEKLGHCFGFHPLILEDIVNTNQRPKLEDYKDYLYIVLKMIYFQADKPDKLVTEQVSLILGNNFLISFQEDMAGDVFNLIRENLRSRKGKARELGADYLAYSMIDAIVDNYFAIIENFEDKMEGIETQLVSDPRPRVLHSIHALKREAVTLRKAVWPLREVINRMERKESDLIKDTTLVYLRDVYDHTIQIFDNIETMRDILSSMIDIYLSSINNKLNEVMKMLTMFMTVFIPLTLISGIYGMNFHYMPELEWRYGYFAVLGVMVTIAIAMMVYFKRKKWW